jgi:hypothetical protein
LPPYDGFVEIGTERISTVCEVDSTGLGQVPVASCCEHKRKFGFIKEKDFLNQLSNYQRLKKESAVWS